MEAPVIIKEIPAQLVNERAAYGPFDLKDHIQAPDGSDLRFQAEVADGASLPKGMICTEDGVFTGIPGTDTNGTYKIKVTASNDAGSVEAQFSLTIQPNLASKDSHDYGDDLKKQIWQALENDMPVPDLMELMDRPVSPAEVYYLLERWATLTIYDAFNLDPPGEKHVIVLEGASEHYITYDRGCCLVAAPKDLFSHERTLADAIATAEALSREAFKRKWTVELVGFEKMTRAAWVELQAQGEIHKRKAEVLNYSPTTGDVKLYSMHIEKDRAERKVME